MSMHLRGFAIVFTRRSDLRRNPAKHYLVVKCTGTSVPCDGALVKCPFACRADGVGQGVLHSCPEQGMRFSSPWMNRRGFQARYLVSSLLVRSLLIATHHKEHES